MPRISNMIDLIGKIAGSSISVKQERCVLVRNRNADCLRCADACVSGCITYRENELVVAPFSCISCGTCCTVCPTAALEAKKPTDYDLLMACEKAAAANGGTAVVLCARLMAQARKHIDEEKVAQVVCLGRVDESILTALAADGVEKVLLCEGLCKGCDYSCGRETAQVVVDTAREVLDVWHSPMEVRFSAKLPLGIRKESAGYDANKRAALLETKDDAVDAAKVAVTSTIDDKLGTKDACGHSGPTYVHVNEQGVLPHFVPDRRLRLIESVRALGDPDDVMFNTRLWGNVIIDQDKCRSCYMCATFCPTGALEKLIGEEGLAYGIGHNPSKCVKCRTCESICMAKAISISEEVFAVDMLRGVTEQFRMQDQSRAVVSSYGGRYEGFGSR